MRRRLLGGVVVATMLALVPWPAYAEPQEATDARMTVQVDDFALARASAVRLVTDYGGVVVTDGGPAGLQTRLVVRVPPSRLDAAMHSLADLGSLQDQLVTTRDQRAALSEIKLQLHAQQQLVRFLSAREQRATTLAAAKSVRRALVRATTTTEGLRRRLVGLSQEVGTATIDLTLTTGVPLPPQATDEAQPSPLDTLWALLRSAF